MRLHSFRGNLPLLKSKLSPDWCFPVVLECITSYLHRPFFVCQTLDGNTGTNCSVSKPCTCASPLLSTCMTSLQALDLHPYTAMLLGNKCASSTFCSPNLMGLLHRCSSMEQLILVQGMAFLSNPQLKLLSPGSCQAIWRISYITKLIFFLSLSFYLFIFFSGQISEKVRVHLWGNVYGVPKPVTGTRRIHLHCHRCYFAYHTSIFRPVKSLKETRKRNRIT